MTVALAAYPAAAASRLGSLLGVAAALVVVLLAGGLALRWGPLVTAALVILGVEYAGWFSLHGSDLDTRSPLYAVGFVLAAELAFSVLERRIGRYEPGLALRRLAATALFGIVSVALGAAVLAVAALPAGGRTRPGDRRSGRGGRRGCAPRRPGSPRPRPDCAIRGFPDAAGEALAKASLAVLEMIRATHSKGPALLVTGVAISLAGLGLAAWAGGAGPAGATGGVSAGRSDGTARLLFAGDVMLGRGVAPLAAADPQGLLAGIRLRVRSADLAAANLESPLTARPHDPAAGPNALEAPPGSAALLAAAGFDAMGIANNHAGDAGPGTVGDTVRALESAGITALGTGARTVRVAGLRVALLAFDATGEGPPEVARWSPEEARAAVLRARSSADVVAVGLHGGAEYVPETDPYLLRISRLLAGWSVDVVWGSGPHVVQPVRVVDPDGDGRPTVIATSLGNLLFDQHLPGTRRGAILEVLAGADGVRALRVGDTDHFAGPVRFSGWRPPRGDAAALGNAWWTLARPAVPAATRRPGALRGFSGDVVDAVVGDPDGDGRPDTVVAFRRPYSRTSVNVLVPRSRLVDRRGRTAHIGLYRPADLRPRWVAGTLFRPVAAVAACDDALAVAYSTLDRPARVGTGAWRWGGFGFVPLPDLPGPGRPACADLDGDGLLDPLVLERSSR